MEIARVDGTLAISGGRKQRWTYRKPEQHRYYMTPSMGRVEVELGTAEIELPANYQATFADPGASFFWSESQDPVPEWLAEIVDALNVLFITDRRLVIEDSRKGEKGSKREPVRSAVIEYAEDLRQRVLRALSEYGDRAQALDRTFPDRVLGAMRQSGDGRADGDVALAQLEEVEAKRARLEEAGLIQSEQPTPAVSAALSESEVAVLVTYAASALEKYTVLDPLLERVTAFTNFLNARYADKRVRIDRDEGFVVVLDEGGVIEPAALSSGEQQMLVLAYQIIFLAAPDTLVLIDEPELSLHVSWQSTLVDDLVAMGRASKLGFLLATHSPTLIGGRRSLRRSLDPPRQ